MLGEEEMAKMKDGVRIVNCARGGLIDEEALAEALKSGKVAGAGIDVFETEPLERDSVYRTMPNVIATPHIGFVTLENYEIFYRQSLENLKAYLAGAPIRTITSDKPFLESSPMAGEDYKA